MAITNSQSFKAVVMDQAGGKAVTAGSVICTLLDYTVPLTLSIDSTVGSIIKYGY